MHGPFTLLSFSGSYFYNNHNTLHPRPTLPFPLCFGINVLTYQDKILGGVISDSLISADGVTLTISTFKNPSFLNYTYQVGEGITMIKSHLVISMRVTTCWVEQ
ncbi:hypothetical protein V8G54_032638 [Vigna mungo]|uniref:Uncharacterized protein n=1 Tax=Vigna mungo TaxID=3915 RepID=A0AAQ3RIZ7_VIGMU